MPGDSDYILDFDAALRDWTGTNLSPADTQAINNTNADRTYCDSAMRGFAVTLRLPFSLGNGYTNDVRMGPTFALSWTMDSGWIFQGAGNIGLRLPGNQSFGWSPYGVNVNQDKGTSFSAGWSYGNGNGRVGTGASSGSMAGNVTLGLNFGSLFQAGVVVKPSKLVPQ